MTNASIGRRALLREGTAALTRAGVENAASEARFLLCDAEGIGTGDIVLAPEAGVANAQRYRDWIARRASGEPASRITGFRNFRGLDFAVGPSTLDPRLDSEVLVETVLDLVPGDRPVRLVDVGTGTGCLILSVLAERPQAMGVGIDLSADAAGVAWRNARRLGLAGRFLAVAGNWLSPCPRNAFDCVISNPPYIRRDLIAELDAAVRDHDPHLALDGGPDGLDCYRALLPQALAVLKPGGWLAVEIGYDQGPSVQAMMRTAGFERTRVICDLADMDRVIIGRKKDLD